MAAIKDIAYRPGSERGVLDLYLPDGAGPFPVVVVIHGGGWRQGEKERMREFGDVLSAAGIAAIAPNHRLTTTDPHPAQQDDIFAVLEWIAANAAEYRLDPSRVGLTGISAGGHLTALVGLKATRSRARDTGCVVRCMMPFAGVHDLGASPEGQADRWHVVEPMIEALVRGPAEGSDRRLASASPLEQVHPNAPACLAVHGENDRLVGPVHSERLVAALRNASSSQSELATSASADEAEVLVVPGAGHGGYHPNTDPRQPLGGSELFVSFFTKHLMEPR